MMHNFIEAFLLCACLLQWCLVVLPVSTSAKGMDICKDSTVGVLNVGDNGTIEIGETSIYKDTPNPCVLKLKSCSYCQIEIRPTKDNRFHFFCGTNNISPNYCSLGCDYLYMFDMYYMNDTLTFYKWNDFKFVSQSSQVFIVLCHGYSENYRIAMNYTVIKKQQKIEGNSAGYRSVGTIKSPFFPSGYAQNHETYEYQFSSSNHNDYIQLQFDDWNLADSSALLFEDSNIASLVSGHSSRPVVVSNGNAMRVVFHTGQKVGADQERTYIGFKATYRFISDRQTISSPKTDCPGSGYLLDSMGGEITVRATSQAHQFVDCIWVVKKQPGFNGVYLKLATMQLRKISYNTGVNQIQIRSGLTSEGRLIATLKSGTDVHGVPYDDRTGFYVRLNSSLSSTDEVVLSYSSYKDAYTSCSWNSDLFGCTNGRCIDKSLVCNGYDHCGDNSDEMQGCKVPTEDWDSSHKYTITIGVIIPMVISVFLIMVICIVFILVRRCRATRLQQTARAEDRLQTLSEEVANGGRRRRRRRSRPRWFPGNHGSRDNPPTYDEAIQNPPGWYLNVAFGNPADPSLPQPPSYSEAVGGPHDVTRPSGAERPGSPSSSDSSSQSELTIHSRHPSISSLSSEGDSAWASVQTERSGRTGRCGRHDSSSDSDSDGHHHEITVTTPEPSTAVTSNTTETSNTNLEDDNGVKKLSKVMNEDGNDDIKKVGSEEDTMVIPDGPKVTFDSSSSTGRGSRAPGAGQGPGPVDRVPANHGHSASVLSVSSPSSSLATPPGRPRPKPRKSQPKNQRKSIPKYEVPAEGKVSQRVAGSGATDHVPAAGSADVCPGVGDAGAVVNPQLQQPRIADDPKRSPDDCVLVMSDLARGDAHPTRRDRNSSGGPPLVRPTVVGAHGDSRNRSVSDSLERKVGDQPGRGSQPSSPHKDHATWSRDISDQPMVGRRSYPALNTATRDDDNIRHGPTDPSLNSPQSGGQDTTSTSCYPTIDPTSNDNAPYLDESVTSGHTSLASVAGADCSPENPDIYWRGEENDDVYV